VPGGGAVMAGMSPTSSFFEAFGQPVWVAVAEHESDEPGGVVEVLAGVVEIDDLGGGGEAVPGEAPDPGAPSPSMTSWRMRSLPRRQRLGGDEPGEPVGGGEGAQVGRRAWVADGRPWSSTLVWVSRRPWWLILDPPGEVRDLAHGARSRALRRCSPRLPTRRPAGWSLWCLRGQGRGRSRPM
jgi:hypothetical protein